MKRVLIAFGGNKRRIQKIKTNRRGDRKLIGFACVDIVVSFSRLQNGYEL